MKKLNSFVFLFLFSILAYSQNFNSSEIQWNVTSLHINASPNYPSNVDTTTQVYGYQSDTIIDNQVWQSIFRADDEFYTENLIQLGFIRQDGEIVHFIDTNNINHQLYNFSLNIGDSVQYFEGAGVENDYLFVENIDSILINGFYKKQFHFSTSIFPPDLLDEIWIEDIGSIHGPLFPLYPQHFSTEMPNDKKLTCCFFEDNMIWNNPDYTHCYYHSVLPFPSFIEDGKQWNVRLSNFENYVTEILIFDGDSIIDNVSYKKLYSSYDSLITLNYKALIREENNKVYLRHYNQPEALIYDFNLSIGESTTIYSPEGQGFIEVTINDISWVEYEGFFRKKYILDGYNEEYWMEGIGSCFGPIYSKVYDFIICPDWTMTCAYSEEGQIYQFMDYPCYDIKTGITPLVEKHISIYPNPVISGQEYRIINDRIIKEVLIYNYSGQLIQQTKIKDKNEILLSAKNLIKGIYMLVIKDINGQNYSSKLIIN